jgi:GLPGLI family protein
MMKYLKSRFDMKKHLIIFALLAGTIQASVAQKPDTAQLLVHYKFTWIRDTTDRARPYTENMVLYAGKSAGAYRSYDGIVANAQFKKAYAEAVAASPDGNVRINRRGAGTPVEYYQYPNEQKLITKDNLLVNDYLIESPMPAIDWKISGDTATFGGLHCQEATGHFKGRDYIVWFCPDVPVRIGPWKLSGLPGVIVDAHDAKNEVVFKFEGVEKAVFTDVKPIVGADVAEKDAPPILRGLDDNPNIIAPPAKAIKTTQKEFDKLKGAMNKDPEAFVMANNSAQGDAPKMDHIKVIKGPAPGGNKLNNPIELPEK